MRTGRNANGAIGERGEDGGLESVPEAAEEEERGVSADRQMRPDEPMMVDWAAHKATPEYENSKRWASDPGYLDGSLWGLFMAGWLARERRPSTPSAPPASGMSDEERGRVEEIRKGKDPVEWRKGGVPSDGEVVDWLCRARNDLLSIVSKLDAALGAKGEELARLRTAAEEVAKALDLVLCSIGDEHAGKVLTSFRAAYPEPPKDEETRA